MKLIFSILFSFILFTLSAQESNIIREIPSEVKGIKFDTIQVSKFIKSGENYVVYGLLRREGAILEKRKMGKEVIRLRAFAKLEYDKDFNLKNEVLHFIRPQGYEDKDISLIDGPNNLLKTPEVIATPDDILTFRELQRAYPEVYKNQKPAKLIIEEKEIRTMHYANQVLTGSGSRVNGIRVVTRTPKAKKERKGLFAEVARSWEETIPYDTERQEIEFENYANQTKKDYWKASIGSSVPAPMTGRIYSHHIKVIGSDKAKKNNEFFEQELVTFDKEGEVLNRIELAFERPMILGAIRSIKNEKGELEYALFSVREKKRVAKKMGLEPNPRNAYIYILDKDGKQVSAVDFEMASTRMPISKVFPVNGNFLTIGVGFNSFEGYLFGKDKLEASYIFNQGSEEYKKIAPSHKIRILEQLEMGSSTNILGLYTHKNETATPDPMRPNAGKRGYGNYFLLQYDDSGRITNFNHVPRPEIADEFAAPSIEIIKENDVSMTLLAMYSIQKKDTPWKGLHPTVAIVNKSNLEMRVQSLPTSYKLSSDQAFFTEENRVILLVQDEGNKYAFAELKF